MENNIQLLHKLVIWAFLLFFLFKAVLLFLNRKELLTKVRNKTKIIDMILGTLILITGGYLAYITKNTHLYIFIKLALVFAAIPLGIVGFKKENKVLIAIALLNLLAAYGMAEAKRPRLSPGKINVEQSGKDTSDLAIGKAIYIQECARCHGDNGNDGIGAAKDLTKSEMSHDDKVRIIIEGKELMPKFKKILTPEEIEAVTKYVDGLKK